MKKIILPISAILFLLVATLSSLIVGINMQGGVPQSKAWMGDVPVVGGFVQVRDGTEDEAKGGESETESEVEQEETVFSDKNPLVMVASKKRLVELCEQVEAKLVQLEEKERRLQEKEWELEAGKKELASQRKRLLGKLNTREQELQKLQEQVAASQEKLKEMRIRISEEEEVNLIRTAGVYDRMDSGKAAEVLTKMFKSGKERTVVKILSLMRERNAGGILAEFGDPEIGAEITQKLSHVSMNQEGK